MPPLLLDSPTLDPCCWPIRADFDAMPTLCLTLAQSRRLYNLDEFKCQRALEALRVAGLLRLTEDGQYCRADYFPRRDDDY